MGDGVYAVPMPHIHGWLASFCQIAAGKTVMRAVGVQRSNSGGVRSSLYDLL